jgi:DNA-binding CsgD family transcriptional regulator
MSHRLQVKGRREKDMEERESEGLDRLAAGQFRAKAVMTAEREEMDILRGRIVLLQKRDRALVTMCLENGVTFGQIAQVAGLSEGTVSRRMQRIMVRLHNWEYVKLAQRKGLGAGDVAVAREYLVMGLSQREVAAGLGCSREAVICALARIELVTGYKKKIKYQNAKIKIKEKR